jgi:hypothetical protein
MLKVYYRPSPNPAKAAVQAVHLRDLASARLDHVRAERAIRRPGMT